MRLGLPLSLPHLAVHLLAGAHRAPPRAVELIRWDGLPAQDRAERMPVPGSKMLAGIAR